MIYTAVAFELFAEQLFFYYFDEVMKSFDQPYNDVIFYAMTLAILYCSFWGLLDASNNMTMR
jgi:hypothetical protein